MLRPWVEHAPDFTPDANPDADQHVDWTVFGYQLNSWREFREWQNLNRGDFARWDVYDQVSSSYRYFDSEFRRGASDYTVATKGLLLEYGFDRPFQLQEDQTQQDKLTTWIEYLAHECWEHYRYAKRINRLQADYDAAWKKLADSGVLRPFETENYVCDIDSAFHRQSESEQAAKIAALAKSSAEAVLTSVHTGKNKSNQPRLQSSKRQKMMLAAKSRLEAANRALASIQRRNDVITNFKQSVGKFLSYKRDADRLSVRINWIMGQVPLIEAEQNASGRANVSMDRRAGTKRRLATDDDTEPADIQVIKRQKRRANESGAAPRRKHPGVQKGTGRRRHNGRVDGESPIRRLEGDAQSPDPAPGHIAFQSLSRTHLKRSRDNFDDDRPTSKRLKQGIEDSASHKKTRSTTKHSRDESDNDGLPRKRLRRHGEDFASSIMSKDGTFSASIKDHHEASAATNGRATSRPSMRCIAGLYSKRSAAARDQLHPVNGAPVSWQPTAGSPPLRRSARIAAKLQARTMAEARATSNQNLQESPRRKKPPKRRNVLTALQHQEEQHGRHRPLRKT